MRWGIAAVVLATLAQLTLLTANAAPDTVMVTGRVVNARTNDPLAGVELQVWSASPDGQDQGGQPIAQDVTMDNGRFHLSIPRAEPWPLVRIHVFPPADLTCADISLVGVIGAATAYIARQQAPTFTPGPNATPSQGAVYATFEMIGTINVDGSCTGSAGTFKGKPLE